MDKIDSILIPVVGLGNYTAQVDISMDFTNVEETQRRYNSDLPALRSEMSVESTNIGGALGGIPGALTNQPPVESAIPENAVGGQKKVCQVPMYSALILAARLRLPRHTRG
eukprot:TRINITY_DN7926_c0_g1_i1.p1 TRINITY_DN7926_c0_g1~~TRINITY_DN7926_c0_g1_i1.p1  ORF type:complete len:111 (+),score=54.03 TRINITY_DN7926_c0_g1_i1:295-627(+)